MLKLNTLSITVLFVILILLSSAGKSSTLEEYVADNVHSYIGFAVKHMVISTVKGNFTDYSVKIYFDEGDMIKSRAVATIKTASIFTNNEMRDNHLRSEEFFFAEKYPEITFKSTKIVKKAENSILYGTLTMRGVSQEVVIPFKFLGKAKDPWGSTRIGFEGNLTLNRQDYGIAFNKTIDNGGLLVGNEVEIQLNIEAVLQNK